MIKERLIYSERIKWGEVISWFIIFMVLPPIIGLPLSVNFILKKRTPNLTHYVVFFICIAAYFGAINATKGPGGDQINYYLAYLNVPVYGFIGSLKFIYGHTVLNGHEIQNISGEFMNGVYNYVGYYLTFGYYPLFAFIYTIIEYLFILLGFRNFCLAFQKPQKPIVYGTIILTFFYLFFQFIFQIQKQFMGQAIMMYVLGTYSYYGKMTKRLWAFIPISIFTHASTTLFLPFLFYKPMRKRMNRAALLVLTMAFVGGIIMGPGLMSETDWATGDSALSYGASRLAKAEGQDDGAATIPPLQILVIAVPMMWVVFRKLWLERKAYIFEGHAFILNVTLMLLLTMVAMIDMPLARYRYFMMLEMFIPFVYPFFATKVKQRDNILLSIAVVMVGWFYFQFERIIWHYASEIEIIVKPPFWLIAQGFK